MKITVVGSGYVGLCTAVGFASLGHDIVCVDMDRKKVESINSGHAPIYEKDMDRMLNEALRAGRLKAVTSVEEVGHAEFIFIAVGTPSNKDGSIDLKYVESAAESISNFIKTRSYCTVVVKSTVLPETTENMIIPILEASGKKAGKGFGVCTSPEFLREGKAIEDFLNPDRIVIGEFNKKSGDGLEKLYANFKCPIIRTSLKTAEMTKYSSNAFLAAKISFINEIGNMCKKLNIDTYEVAEGMGLDKRIGLHFLQAGVGFGGSCFRKDVEALLSKSKAIGSRADMLDTVLRVNQLQPLRIVELLKEKVDLNGKAVAVLGLAFKEDTDDVRDSPAIPIISELLKEGCSIRCYDPKASKNMGRIFPEINYAKSAAEALTSSDACLILTGWDEFKELTDKDFDVMKNRVIIEGRRVLGKNKVKEFDGVCW